MKVLRFTAILLALLLACLYFAWMKAPAFIAQNLSKKMHVEVQIDDITLSRSSIKIDNIVIGSPANSSLPKAFSAKSIECKISLTNLIKDPLVIDTLEVNDVYLGLEFTSPTMTQGNWTRLIENLKKSSPPQNSTTKAATVIIKKLILTNIQADIVYTAIKGNVQKVSPIERIELYNVSSQDGVGYDQIAKMVIEKSVQALLKQENLQPQSGMWEKLKNLLPK